MKITCPGCGFEGNIKDELIPEVGKNLTCPKCKEEFYVKKDKPERQFNPQQKSQQQVETEHEYENITQIADKKMNSGTNQNIQYRKKYIYKIEYIKESFFLGVHRLVKAEKIMNAYADKGWELDKISTGFAGGLLKRESLILVFKYEQIVIEKSE